MMILPVVGRIFRRLFMKRRPVSKRGSARSFRKKVGRTKRMNVAPPPMRGGFRI